MGEIPLMTPTGSFIINGTERVIVSQLHRSPGCSSSTTAARPTARASCCSRRASSLPGPGSTSSSIPRTSSTSASTAPQDASHDPVEGAQLYAGADPPAFLRVRHLPPEQKTGIQFDLVPTAARGDRAASTRHQAGKLIVPKDKRITVKHVREWKPRLHKHRWSRTPDRQGPGAPHRPTRKAARFWRMPTTRSPTRSQEAGGRGVEKIQNHLHQRSGPGPYISRRCGSTRPRTSSPPRWRSIA